MVMVAFSALIIVALVLYYLPPVHISHEVYGLESGQKNPPPTPAL